MTLPTGLTPEQSYLLDTNLENFSICVVLHSLNTHSYQTATSTSTAMAHPTTIFHLAIRSDWEGQVTSKSEYYAPTYPQVKRLSNACKRSGDLTCAFLWFRRDLSMQPQRQSC